MANNKKRNRSNRNRYSLYQYPKNNNQLYTPRKDQGPFPESIRMEETNMIEIKTDNQGNQTKRYLKHKSITINGSKKY